MIYKLLHPLANYLRRYILFKCCSLGGPDVFSVPCFFHCSDGDFELQSKCWTDRGTVLWPELGSECCSLGGPDLFSVPCPFQCSYHDSEL